MRKNLTVIMTLLGTVGGLQMGGCVALFPPQTIARSLGSSGVFSTEAGVAKENVFVSNFDTGFVLAAGALRINPAAITVTPGGTAGKGLVNLQTNTLTVEVRIAAAGEESTVCESGELYGPYAVELDDNFGVVSVDPPSVTFTPATVALLNGGTFVLCIRVEANFDGQVRIEQLEFTVQLG